MYLFKRVTAQTILLVSWNTFYNFNLIHADVNNTEINNQ